MKYSSEKLNCNLLDDLLKKINLKYNENHDLKCYDESTLRSLISDKGNVVRGRNSNVFNILLDCDLYRETCKVKDFIEEKFNKKVTSSNFIQYPVNGYMRWHTNSDYPGERIYVVYSENGESYFKYLDNDSDKVIEIKDNVGWSINTFCIPKLPEKFWHCVYSHTNRISIGFRVIE